MRINVGAHTVMRIVAVVFCSYLFHISYLNLLRRVALRQKPFFKGPSYKNLITIFKILGPKRKMGLGFSPMVLCVVQRLCGLTFFRPYRTLHLLISKAEISHEHCERTVVFLEPLSFCQQREVTKSLQLKPRCV